MNQEMRYVYQVYTDGSFSKAAENLYISQPALSMAIARVEDQLGAPIFDRSTRPLTMTQAGEVYISTIKEIILLEENLQHKIDDIQNVKRGTIKIGATHYINAYYLPQVILSFQKKYPNVNIEIFEHGTPVLINMLQENQIDLYFCCDPEVVAKFPNDKVFTDQMLLAVPAFFPVNQNVAESALSAQDIVDRRHLDPTCPTVSLASFDSTPFILLFEGSNYYERSVHMFSEINMTPMVTLQVSSSVTAFRLAASGLGAVFVVDRLVQPNDNNMFYYKISSEFSSRHNYLLRPQKKYTSAAVAAFIRHLKESVS